MKHTIDELFETSMGLSIVDFDDTNHHAHGRICNYKKNNGSFYYINLDGEKVKAWQFGEKTWFDTMEERDEYKAQSNKAYDELVAKNKVLKQITEKLNQKNIEELLDILAQM